MLEFNKKMSKSGGVTIPAALRRELGLPEREKFLIQPQADGNILLKRIEGQCMFCKSDQNLIVYESRYVCKDCVAAMQEVTTCKQS